MPCCICCPCVNISIMIFIFVKIPILWDFITPILAVSSSDRQKGSQIRSRIHQVTMENHAVLYLWSLCQYFDHDLLFRQNPHIVWCYDTNLSSIELGSSERKPNKEQDSPGNNRKTCCVLFVVLVSLFRSRSSFSSKSPYCVMLLHQCQHYRARIVRKDAK